jgi:hypothetical protein
LQTFPEMLSMELWDFLFAVQSVNLRHELISDSLAWFDIDLEPGCCPYTAEVSKMITRVLARVLKQFLPVFSTAFECF